jgi:hypothetical protein
MSYQERIKNIIKANGFSEDELVKYWIDFESAFSDIFSRMTETFHTFRQIAEGVTYSELKNDGRVGPYMIENTKADVDADIVNI